jgi:hypothetical protein
MWITVLFGQRLPNSILGMGMFEERFGVNQHLCWIILKAGFTGQFEQMLSQDRADGVRPNL